MKDKCHQYHIFVLGQYSLRDKGKMRHQITILGGFFNGKDSGLL